MPGVCDLLSEKTQTIFDNTSEVPWFMKVFRQISTEQEYIHKNFYMV